MMKFTKNSISAARLAALLIASVFAVSIADAQPSPGGHRPSPLDGPWNRDLYLSHSPDGRTFSDSRVFLERGGVPCVIRDQDSRLVGVFQWFPIDDRNAFDRVAVIFSRDEGATWTRPLRVQVDSLPVGAMRPFDPTIVQLRDGRFRLYFTSQMPERRKPGIYSAISFDAVNYTFEPGLRSDTDATIVDAGVTFWRDLWHMFAHYSGQSGPPSPGRTRYGYHAVSGDGLNFTQLADVEGPPESNWIGNPVATSEGLRYYATGRNGIWSAVSRDGAVWRADPAVRVKGGDPTVLRIADGSWVMISVGEMRADAISHPFQETPPPHRPASSLPPPSTSASGNPYMRPGAPPPDRNRQPRY